MKFLFTTLSLSTPTTCSTCFSHSHFPPPQATFSIRIIFRDNQPPSLIAFPHKQQRNQSTLCNWATHYAVQLLFPINPSEQNHKREENKGESTRTCNRSQEEKRKEKHIERQSTCSTTFTHCPLATPTPTTLVLTPADSFNQLKTQRTTNAVHRHPFMADPPGITHSQPPHPPPIGHHRTIHLQSTIILNPSTAPVAYKHTPTSAESPNKWTPIIHRHPSTAALPLRLELRCLSRPYVLP